jgi:hypothetical protein
MSIGKRAWVGVIAIAVTSCGLCGDEDLQRVTSPDERLVAVLTERNCGATTDFTDRVIFESGPKASLPLRSALAVVNEIFRTEGRWVTTIEWIDSERLVISYYSNMPEDKVFYQTTKKFGVTVSYNAIESRR